MWRPKAWKIEYELGKDNMAYRDAFEAGADAMLEAMRGDKENAVHFGKGKWTDDATFETDKPGIVVFIPDEIKSKRKTEKDSGMTMEKLDAAIKLVKERYPQWG